MTRSVVAIDTGGANLASLREAFARLNATMTVTREAGRIRDAQRVVLPGVGAAGDGMRRLRAAGLDRLIPTLSQPVLGICLGMHLLYDASAEDDTACLGVLPGTVSALPGDAGVSVPHMGWNRLESVKGHPALAGLSGNDWFWFAHGYAAPANSRTLAGGRHGSRFAAIAGRENVLAVQFHPERSAASGARFLRNFLDWNGTPG